METATPMLRQYHQIKAEHKDCILFFRLGDFYEMFYDDAKVASRILDLVLTSRGKGTSASAPMCGIPYHAAENYIARLIKAGQKVAICEQLEDPALAKGIVKRNVVRVITSGTFLDENSADARMLVCLCPSGKDRDSGVGVAFIDPATGTIQANQYDNLPRALEVCGRLPVCECVFPAGTEERLPGLLNHPLLRAKDVTFSPHDEWCFNPDLARKTLLDHFGVQTLAGFGLEGLPLAVAASGALLEYLKTMNRQPLKHIDRLALFSDEKYAFLSPAAVYGLELDQLFRTINLTQCALGKRQLHFWLFHPLKQPAAILSRQAAVALLKDRPEAGRKLRELLSLMPDVEKCVSKLSCGYVQAKDVLAIRNALGLAPSLAAALAPVRDKNRLFSVEDVPGLRELLERAVNPEMPLANNEGKVVRRGFHAELDALKALQENGRQWLRDFQESEARRTRIHSLKVGFNQVFGYYIEISNAHRSSVPADYIRKQTLVNGERYITPELKEHEEKILTAQERIFKIETEILEQLRQEILKNSVPLHGFCQSVAALDALGSLSALAAQPGYVAPVVDEDNTIDIRDGRHPVVEKYVSGDFVANDTLLDRGERQLVILTGPNMAGKSTYIRQTALLVILAQMGSYVPAASARVGVVDKIFTRIGAHDDITKGQSTFMVEMTEAADILNNLSDRSLVILDEIGRGTSTFDGLSLAWALAEYLSQKGARTLFATHFHELTALAEDHPNIKNYNVAVKEWKDQVIFLHKIVEGSSDDSYGIYVAKLAGVPTPVIHHAKKILTQLELNENLKARLRGRPVGGDQLSFFAAPEPADETARQIKETLSALDINTLTPLEALNHLQDIKKLL